MIAASVEQDGKTLHIAFDPSRMSNDCVCQLRVDELTHYVAESIKATKDHKSSRVEFRLTALSL